MTTKKYLGIWMDHSVAHLMELDQKQIHSTTIKSGFSHTEKQQVLHRSEHTMHNKEQQEQISFYKKISDVIKNFGAVVIFGPTTAKNELYNLYKAYAGFESVKIKVTHADKMTVNEQQAFVRNYFQIHNPV